MTPPPTRPSGGGAAVAAQIVSAPAEHAGNTFWLSGPESISYAEAAAQLSAVLGRPITYSTISFDDQQAAMIAAGMPEALAHTNTQALELFSHGDSDWVTRDVARILGRPAGTFGDFAAEHARPLHRESPALPIHRRKIGRCRPMIGSPTRRLPSRERNVEIGRRHRPRRLERPLPPAL